MAIVGLTGKGAVGILHISAQGGNPVLAAIALCNGDIQIGLAHQNEVVRVGGAAVGGAATFGVLGAKHIAKKGTEAIAKDGVTGLLSKAATYAKSSKWTLALGAFVGVICVGLKYWLNKNKTTDSAQTAS